MTTRGAHVLRATTFVLVVLCIIAPISWLNANHAPSQAARSLFRRHPQTPGEGTDIGAPKPGTSTTPESNPTPTTSPRLTTSPRPTTSPPPRPTSTPNEGDDPPTSSTRSTTSVPTTSVAPTSSIHATTTTTPSTRSVTTSLRTGVSILPNTASRTTNNVPKQTNRPSDLPEDESTNETQNEDPNTDDDRDNDTGSTPFFQNTAAVAATFTIAGIAVAILLAAVFVVLRRRSIRKREDEEFQDEYRQFGDDAASVNHQRYPDPSATFDNASDHGVDHGAPPMQMAQPYSNYMPSAPPHSNQSEYPNDPGFQVPANAYDLGHPFSEQARLNYHAGVSGYPSFIAVAPTQANHIGDADSFYGAQDTRMSTGGYVDVQHVSEYDNNRMH